VYNIIAKKTQEVLQFGNQQNRQADTRNYARAEKRRESQLTQYHNNIPTHIIPTPTIVGHAGSIDCQRNYTYIYYNI